MKCGKTLQLQKQSQSVICALERGDSTLVAQSTPGPNAWSSEQPACELLRQHQVLYTIRRRLILLFTSLLTIPLARQRFLDAALFAGLEVEGVTLHFLDDVLLLYFTLKPAQCIFERFAFLHANFCQTNDTPKLTRCGSL